MAPPIMRPLSFGEILDGAFTLYRRNFVTFAVTALLPTAVLMVAFVMLGGGIVAAMTSTDPTAIFGAMLGAGFILFIVAMVTVLVMWGALTREAAQSYTGQPISVQDGIAAGTRAAPRLFGAMLLAGIAVFVAVIAAGFVSAILIPLFAAMGSVMVVVGSLLVVLAVMAMYMIAIGVMFGIAPAVVVEGAGPLEALERSFTLARGALGRVIGLMVVTILITYLPMMAVMALTGGFTQIMNPQAIPSPSQVITQQLLGMGVGVLTTPFMVAVIVLLYFDRRVRTEALDVQMMADRLAVAGQ